MKKLALRDARMIVQNMTWKNMVVVGWTAGGSAASLALVRLRRESDGIIKAELLRAEMSEKETGKPGDSSLDPGAVDRALSCVPQHCPVIVVTSYPSWWRLPGTLKERAMRLVEHKKSERVLEAKLQERACFVVGSTGIDYMTAQAWNAWGTSPFRSATVCIIDNVGPTWSVRSWSAGFGPQWTGMRALDSHDCSVGERFPNSLASFCEAWMDYLNTDLGFSSLGSFMEYAAQAHRKHAKAVKEITSEVSGLTSEAMILDWRVGVRPIIEERREYGWARLLTAVAKKSGARLRDVLVTRRFLVEESHELLAATVFKIYTGGLSRAISEAVMETRTPPHPAREALNVILSGRMADHFEANIEATARLRNLHGSQLKVATAFNNHDGGALGAALALAGKKLSRPFNPMMGYYDRPRTIDMERLAGFARTIVTYLEKYGWVGLSYGAVEYGTRTLGARVILCSPGTSMLHALKQYPEWKVPTCLTEASFTHLLFDVPAQFHDPYGTTVAPVRGEALSRLSGLQQWVSADGVMYPRVQTVRRPADDNTWDGSLILALVLEQLVNAGHDPLLLTATLSEGDMPTSNRVDQVSPHIKAGLPILSLQGDQLVPIVEETEVVVDDELPVLMEVE